MGIRLRSWLESCILRRCSRLRHAVRGPREVRGGAGGRSPAGTGSWPRPCLAAPQRSASRQRLTLRACLRQIGIFDLDRVGRAQGAGQGGWHAEAEHGQCPGHPLTQAAGGAGGESCSVLWPGPGASLRRRVHIPREPGQPRQGGQLLLRHRRARVGGFLCPSGNPVGRHRASPPVSGSRDS